MFEQSSCVSVFEQSSCVSVFDQSSCVRAEQSVWAEQSRAVCLSRVNQEMKILYTLHTVNLLCLKPLFCVLD